MKKLLMLVFLIALPHGSSTLANGLADKSPNKTTEWETARDTFWRQFYLGLEEDETDGLNVNERANRIFLKKLKKVLRSRKLPWYDIEFAPDSAKTPYLIMLSITRFPNGRFKEVAARYIQKKPRYEWRITLGRRLSNYYAAYNIADEIPISIPDIKREVESRAIKAIIDSALAKRKGDTLLPGMGHIKGQVVDSVTNKPLSGTEVMLAFMSHRWSELIAKTDEQGNFEVLNVPAGIWDVEIGYRGISCNRLTYKVNIKEDETVSIGAVKLGTIPVGNGRITGQVVDSSTSEPLGGAKIQLGCSNGGPTQLDAITDENGFFEILKVPAGAWDIAIYYNSTHGTHGGKGVHDVRVEEMQSVSLGVVKLEQRKSRVYHH